MTEWWTYSLSDFLLFSERVYFRLLEIHNAALWPAQIVTVAVGCAMVFLLLFSGRVGSRLVMLGLGILWIWIAWSFFWQRYATINWAAPYVAPVFAAEGLALLAVSAKGGLSVDPADRSLPIMAAAAVLAFSLLAYPLLAPALGRSWRAAEVFGIAPDPTAAATLAVLAASSGRLRSALMLVPLIWVAVTGLTLWTMGAPEFAVAPACAIAALAIAVARNRAGCGQAQ